MAHLGLVEDVVMIKVIHGTSDVCHKFVCHGHGEILPDDCSQQCDIPVSKRGSLTLSLEIQYNTLLCFS